MVVGWRCELEIFANATEIVFNKQLADKRANW